MDPAGRFWQVREASTQQPNHTAPVEYVKADLEIQEKGVPLLRDCMATVADDPLTYDILKDYLADEEEDLYWLRGQLELCAKIGLQNYLPTLI
ncbi:MAG: hypothetical protein IJ829_06265 [Kiritimatiellae bacterium]|nr:hypothetical protein [Kiritimatiellia bacterium]